MNIRSPRILSLLLLLAGAAILPLKAQTITGHILLNDTFADGNRTGQSLPDSANWVGSVAGATLSLTDGALRQTGSVSNPIVLGYFTTPSAEVPKPMVSLAVGESLTLSFSLGITTPGTTTGGLRFGLFDSSNSTRKTSDFFPTHDSVLSSYNGYFTTDTPGGGSGSIRFYQSGANELIGGSLSGNGHTQAGSSGGGNASAFVSGNTYATTFVISRLETGVSLSVSYTGIFGTGTTTSTLTHSVTDTGSSPVTTFDTIAFYLHGTSTADAISLDNIKIVYSQLTTVPEPSTAGLFAGGILLVAAAGAHCRRR
ncbi:MAG: PEP-CTERM sorting domain-containing protein [Opitutaceae bacterium]|jgi:hypothetical protein|nr:PEP-CTERM sorting domain-containing protein [Opitutaceae bacterium]